MRVALASLTVAVLLAGCSGGGVSDCSHEPAPPGVPTKGRPTCRYCRSLAGPLEDRVADCLAALPRFNPSDAVRDGLERLSDEGGLLVIGGGIPGFASVSWADDPEIRASLIATDERAAAETLREKGIRAVVVHRDLDGAVDRDRMVLARLVHHGFLEWFSLRHVTRDAFVYSVRSSRASVSEEAGSQLVAGLRDRLTGTESARSRWQPDHVRLVGCLRLQGETLAIRYHAGDDLEEVLDRLAGKLRFTWERRVEPLGLGTLDERLDDVRLEVHVVMERAAIERPSPWAMDRLLELGIDGVVVKQFAGTDDERLAVVPGSEATTRSHGSAREFLTHVIDSTGWGGRHGWEHRSYSYDVIRTRHFVESTPGGGDGAVVELQRGLPEVTVESMTDRRLQQMLVDGAEWWVRNMSPEGDVLYKYWPVGNRRSTEYNEVRHILGSRDLADAWRYRHDPRYLAAARRNMDWLLRFEVTDASEPHATLPGPNEGGLLFRYPAKPTATKVPNQKLGTVAVALLGWIAWAEASGSHDEDDRIRRMATWVLSMQSDDGRFEPYHVPRSHSYFGQKNDIVPGEAALALIRVADYFDEDHWLAFFPAFLDYYEPWFRERAARKRPHGRWPHDTYEDGTRLDLVQFGPWSVMASRDYYLATGDERAAAFGLEVADWMIDNYQWTAERAPFPDYVGGYYKNAVELPAMQTFCYSEGTAAAYRIAIDFAPKRKQKYARATLHSLRFLDVMQYDERDSYYVSRPQLVHGGVKYALNENRIRIDYVGHALSTIVQFLDARAADPDWKLDIRDPGELE